MQASDLTDHISRRFNKELEDLRSLVLSMGGVVETQLSRAISAIVSGDSELGLKVAGDDYKVNNLEVSIDEECSRLIATRAPAAGDLRLIVAIIKTITDLERIGDEAEKLGKLYGKQIPAIKKALAGADGAEVAGCVARGEPVVIEVPDGEISIDAENLLVETSAEEGYACAEDAGFLVD